jgi:hypothetical protein
VPSQQITMFFGIATPPRVKKLPLSYVGVDFGSI